MAKIDIQKMAQINHTQLLSHLPATLVEMAQVIGIASTLKVIDSFGGLSYAMPTSTDSDNAKKLAAVIGIEATKALIHRFGGEVVYINTCQSLRIAMRNQAFVEAVLSTMETGISQYKAIQEVAPVFGITERLAYLILGSQNTKQADLFDYDISQENIDER